MGIALIPMVSVKEALAAERLVRINCNGLMGPVSLIMIWHAQKWCSPILGQFQELATQVMAG